MALVNHQDIFDDFKLKLIEVMPKSREFNSAFAACCRKLARDLNHKHKEALDEAVKGLVAPSESVDCDYTDEEAIAYFLKNIKAKAVSGEFDAAFAGKIMETLNVRMKDRDVIIQTVLYKDVADAPPEDLED